MKRVLIFTLFSLGFMMVSTAQKTELRKIETSTNKESYFLKIEGINGNSKEQNHKNWIQLLGIDFELKKPTVNGTASGRSTLQLGVEKPLDNASDMLMSMAQNGTKNQNVIIEITQKTNQKEAVVLKIAINSLIIKDIFLHTDIDNSTLIESIQFDIQSAVLTYYMYDENGNLKTTKNVEVGFSNI